MTIPLQFASLYDRQEIFMWSYCLLDLGMDFLFGNMVFVEMPSILQEHLRCILLRLVFFFGALL